MGLYNTTRFGEIEVNADDIVTLPEGLLGFPEYKHYVLLDFDPESPFKWLQCLDEGTIAFTLMDPKIVRPDYQVFLTDDIADKIGLDDANDAIVSTIVTMPSNPDNMTINLKGPLVFNLKTRQGIQVITGDNYSTRHNIMDEMRTRSDQQS